MNTFEFTDGNNNRYLISPSSIDYVPVTKSESSSGFYSGGRPCSVEISENEYQKIQTLFNKAFDELENPDNGRKKGTALIRRTGDTRLLTALLDRDSKLLGEVTGLLRTLLNKNC